MFKSMESSPQSHICALSLVCSNQQTDSFRRSYFCTEYAELRHYHEYRQIVQNKRVPKPREVKPGILENE